MYETTTVESCEECGARFRWDPTMYRLCDDCLLEAERAATPGPRFPFSDSTKAPKARKVRKVGGPLVVRGPVCICANCPNCAPGCIVCAAQRNPV